MAQLRRPQGQLQQLMMQDGFIDHMPQEQAEFVRVFHMLKRILERALQLWIIPDANPIWTNRRTAGE